MMRSLVLLVCCALCACRGELSVPADRPPLSFAEVEKPPLPAGFSGPDVHACAADPTRAYLGELFKSGLDDPQVLWHWAPVVPGPDAAHPTLAQPEFSLAGTIAAADDSTDDVLADHPFGVDIDADVVPDHAYTYLPFENNRSAMLHTEIESRMFPREAMGFTPQAGDRVLMRGAWILDCGHPPYGAEMHPPTFSAYARAAGQVTTAAVFVAPLRTSLLFSGDASLATALAGTARFDQPGVTSFPHALVSAVETAVLEGQQRLGTHSLMVATRFDQLDFLVCAPLPRPPGAQLDASWRLTARTGVGVSVEELPASGCVHVTAQMDASYVPAPLALQTADWPWQQISDSASGQLGASVDVRQAILDALKAHGIDASGAPALQLDHPPLVDAYAALQPRPGAALDAPTAVDTRADDQPFPLYGRIRAAWK